MEGVVVLLGLVVFLFLCGLGLIALGGDGGGPRP